MLKPYRFIAVPPHRNPRLGPMAIQALAALCRFAPWACKEHTGVDREAVKVLAGDSVERGILPLLSRTTPLNIAKCMYSHQASRSLDRTRSCRASGRWNVTFNVSFGRPLRAPVVIYNFNMRGLRPGWIGTLNPPVERRKIRATVFAVARASRSPRHVLSSIRYAGPGRGP